MVSGDALLERCGQGEQRAAGAAPGSEVCGAWAHRLDATPLVLLALQVARAARQGEEPVRHGVLLWFEMERFQKGPVILAMFDDIQVDLAESHVDLCAG